MRILGVSKRWPKLKKDEFTTFRFSRRDKDWCPNEVVQIVLNPRSKKRQILGTAQIINVEPRCMCWHGSKLPDPIVTDEEAMDDGFEPAGEKKAYFVMWEWLWAVYGPERLLNEPMSKLTLRWVARMGGLVTAETIKRTFGQDVAEDFNAAKVYWPSK